MNANCEDSGSVSSISNSNESGFYEIENVISHRVHLKARKYIIQLEVKWKGYEEKTWQDFTDFAKDSSEMV